MESFTCCSNSVILLFLVDIVVLDSFTLVCKFNTFVSAFFVAACDSDNCFFNVSNSFNKAVLLMDGEEEEDCFVVSTTGGTSTTRDFVGTGVFIFSGTVCGTFSGTFSFFLLALLLSEALARLAGGGAVKRLLTIGLGGTLVDVEVPILSLSESSSSSSPQAPPSSSTSCIVEVNVDILPSTVPNASIVVGGADKTGVGAFFLGTGLGLGLDGIRLDIFITELPIVLRDFGADGVFFVFILNFGFAIGFDGRGGGDLSEGGAGIGGAELGGAELGGADKGGADKGGAELGGGADKGGAELGGSAPKEVFLEKLGVGGAFPDGGSSDDARRGGLASNGGGGPIGKPLCEGGKLGGGGANKFVGAPPLRWKDLRDSGRDFGTDEPGGGPGGIEFGGKPGGGGANEIEFGGKPGGGGANEIEFGGKPGGGGPSGTLFDDTGFAFCFIFGGNPGGAPISKDRPIPGGAPDGGGPIFDFGGIFLGGPPGGGPMLGFCVMDVEGGFICGGKGGSPEGGAKEGGKPGGGGIDGGGPMGIVS